MKLPFLKKKTQKKLKKTLSSDKWIFGIITLISLITIFIFRKEFIDHWDAFTYNLNIIEARRNGLLFGRIGFVFLHVVIFNTLKLFGLEPHNYHHITMGLNILLSSLAPGLVFLFIKKLFTSKLLGIITAAFFLFNLGYLDYASMAMPETMMIFFLSLSFTLLTYGILDQKKHLIYIGAASFGFAFEVKEQTLILSLFVASLFLLHKKNFKKDFWKTSLISAAIFSIVAFIGPLIFFLIEGQNYIKSISNTQAVPVGAGSETNIFLEKSLDIHKFLLQNFGEILVYLAPVGLFFLALHKKWKHVLLCITLLLPLIAHLFIGYIVPRYLLYFNFILSLLTAYAVVSIPSLLLTTKKHLIIASTLLSLTLVGFQLNYISPILITSKLNTVFKYRYTEAIYNTVEENAVLITGKYGSALEFYYKPLKNRPQWTNILSGWDWPKEDIELVLVEHLSNNRPVYIETSKLPNYELVDVIKGNRSYTTLALGKTFKRILLKENFYKKLIEKKQTAITQHGNFKISKDLIDKIHQEL